MTPHPREWHGDIEPSRHVEDFRVLSVVPRDDPAVATVRSALRAAGAEERADGRTTVDLRMLPVGSLGDDVATDGYLLDTTGGDIVLVATEPGGLWNGAQTLRQMLRPDAHGALVCCARVRDWPALPMRGVIEGFYGPAWSSDDRRSMLTFCGAHKLNLFVYAPKDDPYHRVQWRDPYPPSELSELADLVELAHANRVDFVYAISPGLSVQHASDADRTALVAKAEQLRTVGVDGFWLLFDDIEPTLRDSSDLARFGAALSPLASAQAYLANRFHDDYYVGGRFRQRLVVVPVEYAGTSPTPYRRCLAQQLHREIPVCWTGPDVVCRTITADDVVAAHECFGRKLVVWDNYPTNDFDPGRIFLGPLTGRDRATCASPVVGFVANAMVRQAPSRLPLVSIADFLWNPEAYDAETAHQRALRDIGGAEHAALAVLAAGCGSSLRDNAMAAALAQQSESFWCPSPGGAGSPAAERLLATFDEFAFAAETVRVRLPDEEFAAQCGPWLDTLELSGRAGSAAVRALTAKADGDVEQAWQRGAEFLRRRDELAERYPAVLRDVVDAFLCHAAAALDLVSISAQPHGEASVDIHIDVTPGAVPVHRIEIWDADRPVLRLPGKTTAASWLWEAPAEGGHVLTGVATRADGLTIRSAPARVTVGRTKSALVLAADGGSVSRGDVLLRDRLARLGFDAWLGSVLPENALPDLVVVAASADLGAVESVRELPAPVLACGFFDELGLTHGSDIRAPAEFLTVLPNRSSLRSGVSGRAVRVYRGPGRLRWGRVGPSAIVMATLVDEPEKACGFGYERGERMPALHAPARRAGTFMAEAGPVPALVTPEGLRLFDAAVSWTGDGRRGDTCVARVRGASG